MFTILPLWIYPISLCNFIVVSGIKESLWGIFVSKWCKLKYRLLYLEEFCNWPEWAKFPNFYSAIVEQLKWNRGPPLSLSYFYLFKLIFNWWKIALQCCVGFCGTTTWIGQNTHTPPPSWTSLPHPSLPLWVVTERQAEPPVYYSSFPPLSVSRSSVYVSMLLSQFVPPSLYPAVSTACVSMSGLECVFLGYIDVTSYNPLHQRLKAAEEKKRVTSLPHLMSSSQ